MTYFPTNELVCVAWLRANTSLLPGQVATTLPGPVSGVLGWADTGFVTVRTLSTNTGVSTSLPVRSPILTLDTWAAPSDGSSKPRWNLAAQLAEVVRYSMDNDVQKFGKVLPIGAAFQSARVLAMYFISEPRRVENDPDAYARYTFDIIADWVLA